MEVDCLSLQASAQINSGRPQAGTETSRTAYVIGQEIENIWGQANSAIPLAQGLLEMGAYSEALTKASHAVSLARTAGMLVVLGAGLITLGTVYQTMLSLDAARTVHLEALEMLEPSGMRPLIEIVSAELCTDCALAGAWSEAYRHALRVLKGRTYTVMYSTQFTPWYMVETLVRAGEVEHAREEVDGYGEHLGSSLRYRIPYLRALTVLAESQGEIEQATRHLQEAAQLAEEIGLPGELWSIQAALGEVYQQHGDENQASQAFARAAQIVESLAGKIEDERQRATFLLAQPVQHIFQRTAQN
jgi:tetratricopeptide (TPR) repeat protein